jgi:hypothetical protein
VGDVDIKNDQTKIDVFIWSLSKLAVKK